MSIGNHSIGAAPIGAQEPVNQPQESGSNQLITTNIAAGGTGSGPPVTRKGDADIVHCSTPFRLEHSPNVFVNGIQVSRQGDLNTPHLKPCGPGCCVHQASITIGSTTVFVNGKGCGRIGDDVGGSGCTKVAEGSPNVFAGG